MREGRGDDGGVTIVEVAPRVFAGLGATMRLDEWPRRWREMLTRVYETLHAHGVAHRGVNIMVYQPRRDGLTDIACGVELAAADFDAIGDVVCCETPSGRAARGVNVGDYAGLHATHQRVVAGIANAGLRPAAGVWEIYGHWTGKMDDARVEVFHAVAAGLPDDAHEHRLSLHSSSSSTAR